MTVNGKQISLEELKLKNLLELVRFYELKPQAVAIEMNGEIPSRANWEGILLRETDTIELIGFVGGG